MIGILKGYDQTLNIVLQNTIERIFTLEAFSQEKLGLYMLRGDSIAVVGELDIAIEETIDWTSIRANPLKAVSS